MAAPDLQAALAQVLGAPLLDVCPVGGGSISEAYRARTSDGDVFVKVAPAANADWFRAETAGLAALAVCTALRVPEPLGTTVCADRAYLAMTWVPMRQATAGDHARLGDALAELHALVAPRFGWESDNYIGASPQRNLWCEDWCEFFASRRLGAQLELASANGFGGEVQTLGERVREALPTLLRDEAPAPSLLHGDLWSGNWGTALDGTPVLFDPAVHFGDAECDLAMTELFGGFEPTFYAAYAAHRPPPANVATRRDVYRLYHLLNHMNLFGGGYRAQSIATMRRIVES